MDWQPMHTAPNNERILVRFADGTICSAHRWDDDFLPLVRVWGPRGLLDADHVWFDGDPVEWAPHPAGTGTPLSKL